MTKQGEQSRTRWYCALSQTVNGRRKRTLFSADTQEAVRLARDKYRLEHGKAAPTNKNGLTVGEYKEAFLGQTREQCEPNTWMSYRGALKHISTIENRPLCDLKPEHINAMLSNIRKSVSASMEARVRRVLHTMLEQARGEDKISVNPAKPQKVRQSRKARLARGAQTAPVKGLTADEARALIEASKDDRLAALVIVAITCGLRWGELAGLRWEDIDWTNKTLTVSQTVRESAYLDKKGKVCYEVEFADHAKTDSGRIVDLPQMTTDALRSRQAIAKGEKPSELVFPGKRGEPWRRSNFNRRVWQPIRERAGLPKTTTMHSLRHATASILVSRNASAKMVAARLGHADVGLTLNRYTTLDRPSQQQAASIFDEVLKP
jgi:integrase